jgi:hypothetical protein
MDVDWETRYLIAAALGAAFGYLFGVLKPVGSEWLTDLRRARARRREARKEFAAVRQLMPALITDLRDSLHANPLYRDLLVKPDSEYRHEPYTHAFLYFERDYPNVRKETAVLANAGYLHVLEIGSVMHYRMTESFVELVKAS